MKLEIRKKRDYAHTLPIEASIEISTSDAVTPTHVPIRVATVPAARTPAAVILIAFPTEV